MKGEIKLIKPTLDDLLKKTDNNIYVLVIGAAKRARQLNEDTRKLVDSKSISEVTVALEEISIGKIKHELPQKEN